MTPMEINSHHEEKIVLIPTYANHDKNNELSYELSMRKKLNRVQYEDDLVKIQNPNCS